VSCFVPELFCLFKIVVGTPGTVKNWTKRGQSSYLDLRKVNVFVLDEADKMVEERALGAETMQIRNMLHKDVQILFFSATYTPEVLNYARKVRLLIQFPLREFVSLITRLW
jgi:ATP-dependent RNA helicase DDX19/DBP5